MNRLEAEFERLKLVTLHEREYWLRSKTLAGMDEAGRGPLAGPVVAACAVMPQEPLIPFVKDSKQLSEKRREEVYERIVASAIAYGVGVVHHGEIDEINILASTKKAFRAAYADMNFTPDAVLTDAMEGLNLPVPARSFIKGDQLSYSIAAASIIAKVTRDRHMLEMDVLYPEYGFAKHKGYGTKEHYEALGRHGPCEIHRRTFLKGMDRAPGGAMASKGARGEELAAEYFLADGFEIIGRNYRAAGGEIDIIARRGELIVFAEVKARSSGAFGAGRDALTRPKRERIIRAASDYLARQRSGARARFDVVEVDLNYERIIHLEDAFIMD